MACPNSSHSKSSYDQKGFTRISSKTFNSRPHNLPNKQSTTHNKKSHLGGTTSPITPYPSQNEPQERPRLTKLYTKCGVFSRRIMELTWRVFYLGRVVGGMNRKPSHKKEYARAKLAEQLLDTSIVWFKPSNRPRWNQTKTPLCFQKEFTMKQRTEESSHRVLQWQGRPAHVVVKQ